MIYRYDQPVDMPIPELYDTGLMQAYTQAIREQFEKGEKRLDEFASKYGNFTSPFAKDIQEWDSLTMGRINNIYNDLVSKGIDPLRSREGQAAMAQAIRQTPVGKLNMMLQSAEVGKSYQKAVQDAIRKNQYDPQFEKYLLDNAGIGDFNNYSTSEKGVWNREAPSIYQTLGVATNSWYDEIKPTDKGVNNGYRWRGIDQNDLINIARPRAQAFANTELGGYYKHLIKENLKQMYPLATDKQLEDATNKQFISDIANAHAEKLQMLPEVDQYSLLAVKDKYDRAADERKFRYQLRLSQAKGEIPDANTTAQYPASESSIQNRTVTNTQRNNVVNWLPTLVASKKKHWSSVMANSKKNTKEYNDAKKYLSYWEAVEKNPYSPGKGYVPLLTRDQNGVPIPTKSLRWRYDTELQSSVLKGGSDATAKYINSKTAEFSGNAATRIKNNISNETEAIPGTNFKHRVVDFGTGKYTYSAVKVKGMYGGKGSKLQRMFNNWLKSNNIRTYMTGETVRQDREKGSATTGVNTYYFNTYITGNKLAEFIKYYDDNSKDKKPLSQEAIMRHLGIVRDESKEYTDKNKQKKYLGLFKFSTAYTKKDDPSQAFSDIEYDKSQYGGTNAYNLAPNRQGESLARSENLE